jgi:uncharacterized membrane protein
MASTEPRIENPEAGGRWLIPFAIICLAATIVRVWLCFDPLWFDEIFGLVHAETMRRISDVIFTRHDSNKHHLTALWLWWLGESSPYFLYRIPSLIAGLALAPLVYFAAKPRHGALTAGLAAFFTLTSSEILQLSAEARGYAPAMAFAAAAWVCCGRFVRKPTIGMAGVFWASCLLGFLSHLTFLYAYVGFVLWSAWELPRSPSKNWIARLIALHGPIVLAMLWLYWVDLRFMVYLIGPHLTIYDVFAGSARGWFNIPDGLENTAGLAAMALIGVGLFGMIRRGDSDWPLYAGVILCMGWAIGHRIHAYFALRYVVLAAPFLMVPLAHVIERLAQVRLLRFVVMLAVLTLGALGVRASAAFGGHGPGYPAAIEYMAANSAAGPRAVDCGYDEYADKLVLEYYCRRLGDESDWPAVRPAEWWVIQPLPDAPEIRRGPYAYRLVGQYPMRGSAGGWNLYQREASSP